MRYIIINDATITFHLRYLTVVPTSRSLTIPISRSLTVPTLYATTRLPPNSDDRCFHLYFLLVQ